jgi:hypothetical protein
VKLPITGLMRHSFCAALAALLLVPAAAQADQVTFGSDLTGTPTVTENHQADSLFFNTSAANSHTAPVSGEILGIRVKGTAISQAGRSNNTMWHSQVLQPNSNGTFTVSSSSQDFFFPLDVPASTVSTFVPSTQCVEAGQTIDFNDIGGWDGNPAQPTGTIYKIFQPKTGSQYNWFERDNGTHIGMSFLPGRRVYNNPDGSYKNEQYEGPRTNSELMMQVVVGSGWDASNLCPGGLKGWEYQGVEVKPLSGKLYDDGVGHARLFCSSNTKSFCKGTVRLEVDGQVLGTSGEFTMKPNDTTNIDVPLTNDGARIVNTRGTVEATAIADTTDELGQHKTNTGTSTLISARPTPAGFAGLTVKPQSAGAKSGLAQLKATCPRGTEGSCTGSVALVTQKRIFGRGFGGRRGSLPKVATGSFTIPAGGTARVPVRLSSKGKKLLTAAKTVVTIATVSSTDGAGRPVSKRVKVTLKRR